MIQRIQTIYLLLASIAMGACFFLPLADAIGVNDSLVLHTYKLESLVPDSEPDVASYFIWPMIVLSSLGVVLPFITIFSYKNRMRQLRLIRFAVITLVLLIALFFFYYSPEMERVSGGITMYGVPGAYLPVVSLIFLILASRAVMSDEKLIRSADRLR